MSRLSLQERKEIREVLSGTQGLIDTARERQDFHLLSTATHELIAVLIRLTVVL